VHHILNSSLTSRKIPSVTPPKIPSLGSINKFIIKFKFDCIKLFLI